MSMTFDINTLVYMLEIVVGSLLVSVGVHFVPVGGAPAANGAGYRYRYWYSYPGSRLGIDGITLCRPHDVRH